MLSEYAGRVRRGEEKARQAGEEEDGRSSWRGGTSHASMQRRRDPMIQHTESPSLAREGRRGGSVQDRPVGLVPGADVVS